MMYLLGRIFLLGAPFIGVLAGFPVAALLGWNGAVTAIYIEVTVFMVVVLTALLLLLRARARQSSSVHNAGDIERTVALIVGIPRYLPFLMLGTLCCTWLCTLIASETPLLVSPENVAVYTVNEEGMPEEYLEGATFFRTPWKDKGHVMLPLNQSFKAEVHGGAILFGVEIDYHAEELKDIEFVLNCMEEHEIPATLVHTHLKRPYMNPDYLGDTAAYCWDRLHSGDRNAFVGGQFHNFLTSRYPKISRATTWKVH